VQLFAGSTQVPRAQVTLTMSSEYIGAGACNDGSTSNHCHSGLSDTNAR
jgi:hypothetical protein